VLLCRAHSYSHTLKLIPLRLITPVPPLLLPLMPSNTHIPPTHPLGYQCASISGNTSVPCTPGFYSTGAQSSCTPCPPGFSCPSTHSSAMVPCVDGTYSPGGLAACTVCPGGSQCRCVDDKLLLSIVRSTVPHSTVRLC
jgi:hypothetical protein